MLLAANSGEKQRFLDTPSAHLQTPKINHNELTGSRVNGNSYYHSSSAGTLNGAPYSRF
jgi:hypothetical protein